MVRLPNKHLLRVDEVALFFNVSDRTVRRWIQRGRLEPTKIGGVIRISRDALLVCVNGKRIKALR